MQELLSHIKNLVLVTGLSGAGKTTAARIISDLGYYTIDNLPVELLKDFLQFSKKKPRQFSKLCILLNVVSQDMAKEFISILDKMKRAGTNKVSLIFLECSDEVIVNRYSETRRPHPGFDSERDKTLLDTIARERRRLFAVKEQANFVLDTTELNVHQAKDTIKRYIESVDKEGVPLLRVNFVSFGFRWGIPSDCDLVFDVRFLSNPFFCEGLRELDGREAEIREYVLESKGAEQFLKKAVALLQFLLPAYVREGKAYLNIGIGCTGGRHRSVVVAEELAKRVKAPAGAKISVTHRDISEAVTN